MICRQDTDWHVHTQNPIISGLMIPMETMKHLSNDVYITLNEMKNEHMPCVCGY